MEFAQAKASPQNTVMGDSEPNCDVLKVYQHKEWGGRDALGDVISPCLCSAQHQVRLRVYSPSLYQGKNMSIFWKGEDIPQNVLIGKHNEKHGHELTQPQVICTSSPSRLDLVGQTFVYFGCAVGLKACSGLWCSPLSVCVKRNNVFVLDLPPCLLLDLGERKSTTKGQVKDGLVDGMFCPSAKGGCL